MSDREPGRGAHASGSAYAVQDTAAPGAVELLLAELFRCGIRVSASDGKLLCSGATGALNGDLADRVRTLKPEILSFLEQTAAAPAAQIPARGLSQPPLSAAQKRLWLLETLDPDAAHHMPFALEAHGELDLPALGEALRALAKRHDVLRLRIRANDGIPTQWISSDTTPQIDSADAAALSDPELGARIGAEFARPFDLSSQPPMRLKVLHRGEDRHVLIFTLHHIAADGTSIEVLMRDFAALYGEAVAGFAARLPDLPIQYGDYAHWQEDTARKAERERHLGFWQERLGDGGSVTRLPADHARPPLQSLAGAHHPLALPPALTQRLRDLAQRQGASLFAVLFTAFGVLVHRHTGQNDLILGTPSANRTLPELENLVGLFVNPLPVRLHIDPEQSFEVTLGATHRALLDAQDHQDVPFEQLVERFQEARDPGASPLFQLKFQLDRAPRALMELPGLVLRRLPVTGTVARHDLSLNLVEAAGGGGVAGHIEYATALFDAPTIARLAGHFLRLLEHVAANPACPVGALEYLGEAERHDLLVTWNDTAVEIDPTQRFAQLFEAHAAARPHAVAVRHLAEDDARTETYAALNARANRLAHALRAAGVGAESVVAIALERGPDQVAAWLGVLKSGAAYLPLDPAYPADRLAYMLQDSGATLILTQSDFRLAPGAERWNLDQRWPEGDDSNPVPGTNPDDLAYLIYTSGSTGQPKGVEVPHAGLVNLTLDKLRRCEVTPDARVFGFFSFSFDASIPDLVMALGGGGELITASGEDVLPGPRMAALLRTHGVTHLTITPSALANLPAADLPDLRMVLVGGEAPSRELIETWSRGRLFINAYGPTECTVNASMVPCGNAHPPEPALLAPANKQLHVLDAQDQLLPVGCPGELCIGGLGLARGYRGQSDKTAAAFVPDPFTPAPARLYKTGDRAVRQPDGRITLLGRIDDQVKIRGFRVEPGEIARICETLDGVAEAVVVPCQGNTGVRLVAYLVATGPRPDETRLRAEMKTALPRHMMPDAIVWLAALPLTPNGKLDKAALPPPATAHGGRAPDGVTETALAGIFAALLGGDMPCAETDFFDLGGTSLQVTRLVSAIEDRFGRRLRAVELFDGASIAALARRIEGTAPTARKTPWADDLILDERIAPNAAVAIPEGLPDRVFLTGATGFVGAHVLAELLGNPARHVLCLTRADGARSVERALRRYRLWSPGFGQRIHAISGDLAKPQLGITQGDRTRIARAGIVIHCAATVHHLTPYEGLRAANVTGTQEILRLCCALHLPLHHVSTLSALPHTGPPLDETIRADALDAPEGGYNQTKWVAEQLVAQAGERGLPVTIYRLGSISGHSRSGAYNPADILARQVQGYVASGLAPEGNALINLLPVDYLAQALCHLAGTPRSAGATFHMIHSQAFPSDRLFAALRSESHMPKRIAPADWQALLARIAREEPEHPLFPLAALGNAQGFTGDSWPYACDATRKALRDLPEPAMELADLRPVLAALIADLRPDSPEGDPQAMTETRQDYDSWAWLYDRTLGPDYNHAKKGFFDRVALNDLPEGARVLDLCCGTGQMMAHMLERGLKVTGLDLSRDMLRHAEQNVPGAQLMQGDARDFTLPTPVSTVICASASLNHMETLEDLSQVFTSVFDALEPGGLFVFDVNHPAQMSRHWRAQPAAGDIRADYAWLITPQYDPGTFSGGFTVDMYRKPGKAKGPGPAWFRALLRRPVLRRYKLARLAQFAQTHPDWDHKAVTYPVHGHAIDDVLHLLGKAGFDARAETLTGDCDITADSAACFIARKPHPNARTSA